MGGGDWVEVLRSLTDAPLTPDGDVRTKVDEPLTAQSPTENEDAPALAKQAVRDGVRDWLTELDWLPVGEGA